MNSIKIISRQSSGSVKDQFNLICNRGASIRPLISELEKVLKFVEHSDQVNAIR